MAERSEADPASIRVFSLSFSGLASRSRVPAPGYRVHHFESHPVRQSSDLVTLHCGRHRRRTDRSRGGRSTNVCPRKSKPASFEGLVPLAVSQGCSPLWLLPRRCTRVSVWRGPRVVDALHACWGLRAAPAPSPLERAADSCLGALFLAFCRRLSQDYPGTFPAPPHDLWRPLRNLLGVC